MNTGQVILTHFDGPIRPVFPAMESSSALERKMKNHQPGATYHAADLELPTALIDGLQPARFEQSLCQGLDADHDAVTIRSHRFATR